VDYHYLISKFFAGEITDDELNLLKSWLNMDPENKHIFKEENELWQATSIQANAQHFNADTAWKDISARLDFEKENGKAVTIVTRTNFRILVAAAVLAFIIIIGGLILRISGKNSLNQTLVASTQIVTNDGERATLFLADSTRVILNSGSSIEYDGHYNIKDRIIKFSGEAYFDVSHNPEKPFIVKLEQLSVIVTGTRFNIFSYANEDRIEATLEEGSIKVSIEGKEPVTIEPGEQVVYFVKSGKIYVHDVITETYTSWKENKLRFNDTPFVEVLREIGRRYNVKFEVTSRELLNLKYTGTFIDESIEEVMQMLKTVSPITFEINNLTSVNDKQYRKPTIVVGKD